MASESFKAQFIIKAQERLAAKVPEIRYVNIDLKQLEVSENPPVSWPCVLISFPDTLFADLLGGVQEANPASILVRIADNPYSQSSNLQSIEVREKGLKIYDREYKVYKAFQGWDADGLCQPLTRTREYNEPREADAFQVTGMLFTTSFEDDGAKPVKEKRKPDPVIEPELD